MDIASVKKEIRKRILQDRNRILPAVHQKFSDDLCGALIEEVHRRGGHNIFAYSSFRNEPSLRRFFESSDGLSISLPVIQMDGSDMEFYEWSVEDELRSNHWGIGEPKLDENSTPSIPDEESIIIVPSVALDFGGFRLGYGGGYYDRFLHANPNCFTVGVAFSQFVVEELPREHWDQSLRSVCTENGMTRP